ncbi:hypothetical protein [Acetobacter persici]|nr:hypothetical protein [Acetobacter persici]
MPESGCSQGTEDRQKRPQRIEEVMADHRLKGGNFKMLLRNLRLRAEGRPNSIESFEVISPWVKRARLKALKEQATSDAQGQVDKSQNSQTVRE